MTEPAVDPEQPWLGLNSFTESTRGFFYGREDEVAELARRVQRKLLTVLFGQSGLGKTSILRAGLVPRLRPAGHCPVYVRIDYGPDSPSPAAQIKQAVFRETLASGTWTQTGASEADESLWEFLHHRDDVLLDAQGRPLVPLLIFDQFEEIFTLAQGNDFGRARAAEFIAELADLAENRPPRALEARLEADDSIAERFDFARTDYRILIALREDYLAHLESFKSTMPSITQNRMRLARMTGEQALDAVVKPGGKLVSGEVAEAIVRFVAGGAELRNAEVEPSLLSLICRELNAARMAQGKPEISADLLAGSHATILAKFYERALADQPPGVRHFIEDQLLTESAFRENIAEERVQKAFAEAGAAPGALGTLVDRRLLRIEERLDLRRVELTHDVLCSVVAASREARHEREARDAAEAALASQRERETQTRRALVRARKIASICIVLALVAAAAAAFGIYGMYEAQKTRALAESARGESERLIVYLLDDFYRELEPVGRLEIVGELAKRALAYYDGLPPELRGPETTRNQALAQVRYGVVLRNQGRNAEAAKALGASVATLDGLRAHGDESEPTTIGLAMGLTGQARLGADGDRGEALAAAHRAVELLLAAAPAASQSAALRRALGSAWTQLGFLEQRSGRDEEALKSLQAGLDAYRSVDGLTSDDDAAANFAVTSSWAMDALTALERPADALRIGAKARLVASGVLERKPTHMTALRARALLASNSSTAYGEQLQWARVIESADFAAEDWRTLSRVDPSNVITVNNFGVSHMNAGGALWNLGRLGAAREKFLQGLELQRPASARSGMVSGTLSRLTYLAALADAEAGQLAAGDRELAEARRLSVGWLDSLPKGSFARRLWELALQTSSIEYAVTRGDFAAARQAGKGVSEGFEQLDPGTDPGRQRFKTNIQRRLLTALVRADLESNDLPGAARQARALARIQKETPAVGIEGQRDEAVARALAALALARAGAGDEARAEAAGALAFERRLQAMESDDQVRHLDLSMALVASGAANPAQASVLLGEARTSFDAMAAELRTSRTGRWIEGLIVQEQRSLH